MSGRSALAVISPDRLILLKKLLLASGSFAPRVRKVAAMRLFATLLGEVFSAKLKLKKLKLSKGEILVAAGVR